MTSATAGGVVREVIRANTGTARAGGLVREVIRVSTGQIRIGGVVREALVTTGATSPATRAIVDGVVREALVFTVGPARPVPPGQQKKHHVIEEDDRRAGYEEPDDWAFFIRRPATPLIAARTRWRPWEHHLEVEDADDDSAHHFFLHRGGAPPPVVVTGVRNTLFVANLGRLMGRGP